MMNLTTVFEKADEGGFIGYIIEIPGVNTQGETIEETKANLDDALKLFLETQDIINSKEQ